MGLLLTMVCDTMSAKGDDVMSKFVVRPGVDIPAMLKAKGYSSYNGLDCLAA